MRNAFEPSSAERFVFREGITFRSVMFFGTVVLVLVAPWLGYAGSMKVNDQFRTGDLTYALKVFAAMLLLWATPVTFFIFKKHVVLVDLKSQTLEVFGQIFCWKYSRSTFAFAGITSIRFVEPEDRVDGTWVLQAEVGGQLKTLSSADCDYGYGEAADRIASLIGIAPAKHVVEKT